MGSIRDFKKIDTKSPELQKLQQNVQNYVEPITTVPHLDGVLLKEVCLIPDVANFVTHSLGREPLGFLIVRQRKDARIWDLQDFNSTKISTFSLATSHEVIVDVWVF